MYARMTRGLIFLVGTCRLSAPPTTVSNPTSGRSTIVVSYAVGGTALLLLLLSYFGERLPLADALAVFRTHFAIVAVAAALLLPKMGKATFGVVLAAAAIASATPRATTTTLWGTTDSREYSIYQKNLLFSIITLKSTLI